jgi:LmbE family N-acetylglucosaminyl deacetylase
MRTAMVISPHADDAAAFCGGTLAKFAAQGWKLLMVRVTDDRRDSVGLSIEETIRRNREEMHKAAKHLGIAEIVELGFETDCLADVSLVKLRERMVYLFRKFRPYAVFSFDPCGLYENNQDHVRVAQAVDEAFWVSCFDLHHPEHFKEGLKPFAVCERWYFARELQHPNHYEDITEMIQKKIDALLEHKTAMLNLLNQYRLQLESWGKKVQLIEHSMKQDMKFLLTLYLTEQAKAVARSGKMEEGKMAEVYRLVRFGDLEELFQLSGELLPGAEEPPKRYSLDIYKK